MKECHHAGEPYPQTRPASRMGDRLGRSPDFAGHGVSWAFPIRMRRISGIIPRRSPLTVAGAVAVSHRVPYYPGAARTEAVSVVKMRDASRNATMRRIGDGNDAQGARAMRFDGFRGAALRLPHFLRPGRPGHRDRGSIGIGGLHLVLLRQFTA